MKTLATIILIGISFCAFGQSNMPITKPELLTADTNITFKHHEDVQVLQYFDSDSIKGKITHSKKLDSQGNVIAEYYKDYETDKGNGRADVLTINEYNKKNQLIISTDYFETFQKGEVQKTFFYYNDTLLVRVEGFELKKRLRPNVDKGLGRPGGCIVTENDYEEEPTWEVSRIVLYEYNNNGRKTLSYSPIFKSTHNRYEYEYDSDGNLTVEKSLDGSRLLYTIDYQYQLNQTVSDLHWDNNRWGGRKEIKTYDNYGNLIRESIIQNSEEWIRIYEYNMKNQLVRYTAYDSKGTPDLTHIYLYKK